MFDNIRIHVAENQLLCKVFAAYRNSLFLLLHVADDRVAHQNDDQSTGYCENDFLSSSLSFQLFLRFTKGFLQADRGNQFLYQTHEKIHDQCQKTSWNSAG